ncbi:MAG: winged helix-turn-helix transcriptional regulator [Acidobacteria bacterium]|nr:winged helix-turn-helix transcriptional regulator [Acidobacteriota bacterium]
MPARPKPVTPDQTARYADMFAALGTEPRLRIVRLLLSAHPTGLVVGELITELSIPASTVSHHLDKLKNEGLVRVQREGTYLRYMASEDALQELLNFLYSECCTRTKAVKPESIIQICKG